MHIHLNGTRPAGAPAATPCWAIHPVDASHSPLTIDASQSMGPVRGLVMRPFLKKLFYRLNFTPFTEEAERREKASKIQPIPRRRSAGSPKRLQPPEAECTPRAASGDRTAGHCLSLIGAGTHRARVDLG